MSWQLYIDKWEDPAKINPELYKWIQDHAIITLNIAGNRESTFPGIYRLVYKTLVAFYQHYLS
ncbi:MAG: YpsA SLOG family protein [Bacteroidota bacterium]